MFHALSRCLVGLLRPFRIPGSDIIYQPEIFVTIQVYSSIIGLQSHQVKFRLSLGTVRAACCAVQVSCEHKESGAGSSWALLSVMLQACLAKTHGLA